MLRMRVGDRAALQPWADNHHFAGGPADDLVVAAPGRTSVQLCFPYDVMHRSPV
jgi:hypothetical protein